MSTRLAGRAHGVGEQWGLALRHSAPLPSLHVPSPSHRVPGRAVPRGLPRATAQPPCLPRRLSGPLPRPRRSDGPGGARGGLHAAGRSRALRRPLLHRQSRRPAAHRRWGNRLARCGSARPDPDHPLLMRCPSRATPEPDQRSAHDLARCGA